jgi:hypothetical protein
VCFNLYIDVKPFGVFYSVIWAPGGYDNQPEFQTKTQFGLDRALTTQHFRPNGLLSDREQGVLVILSILDTSEAWVTTVVQATKPAKPIADLGIRIFPIYSRGFPGQN